MGERSVAESAMVTAPSGCVQNPFARVRYSPFGCFSHESLPPARAANVGVST